jgi:aconitate hydratase
MWLSLKGYDPFDAKTAIHTFKGPGVYYDIKKVCQKTQVDLYKLPYTIRILLENLLRHCDGKAVTSLDVLALARWAPDQNRKEIPFMPARVLMQDFTGVPAVVDLAAMRSSLAGRGKDPKNINPLIPVDLVIDHSIQVDYFGTDYSQTKNEELEYVRNKERYALLRWAQESFDNLRVVPPGAGIIHQVNLEYLAQVVTVNNEEGELMVYPDTCVGTDSHTTMINGIGVLGWGVGGIEAEAAMLGFPIDMIPPEVVGVYLKGKLSDGVTATDLVLTVTQLLRKVGVVGKFVEFCGPGLAGLFTSDRVLLANMAPEYGATAGFVPVDENTLEYLLSTGRKAEQVELVKEYSQKQGLFLDRQVIPEYSQLVELDLSSVQPSLAGPKRPQDLIPLPQMKKVYTQVMKDSYHKEAQPVDLKSKRLQDGAVVIAAITSCTNTSNPSVMVGAGLLAKNAVQRGLRVPDYVKTCLSPGSRVVTHYLDKAGLTPYLQALRFHNVGYGCTVCIGNSGPLPKKVGEAVSEEDLVVAAVLSGNRNFEGRINPQVRLNYLASPMLVVAYALAGMVNIDLNREPIGYDPNGEEVYLKDIWPKSEEIDAVISGCLNSEVYSVQYQAALTGEKGWQELSVPKGEVYTWDKSSTYIQEPPFFQSELTDSIGNILGAKALAVLGDSITTDHISPAGAIPLNSPAARYLHSCGVEEIDFNTYGSRRGNHEVMMRGTFGNIRLRNQLIKGVEGGYTLYLPTGEQMSIYEAAMRYRKEGIPLIVIAGKEYGTGSSRDWAAKGTFLLGVKAVLAESFERIHRSNLVGMGVLPLQFLPGQNLQSLGLKGIESFDLVGLDQKIVPGMKITVKAKEDDEICFEVQVRLDTPFEVQHYINGGILQTVLKQLEG